MHLATKDLTVAFKNGEVTNPVEPGHIAFRTDDIEAFKALLDQHSIPYSDYGTAFAKEWHQVFFHDPEGNVNECTPLQLCEASTSIVNDQKYTGRN